jgi:urease accessory protein
VTVSITEVGRQGRLDIAFALRNGRTSIRHSYCEVPFKITRLLDADLPGFAHLILMQCTAGLFGGDDIECAIHVDAGAQVLLTQQSATKVHPSGDLPATQRTRIVVESGAALVADFEPVIPFAESRLHQSMRIELKTGARLVYWEGMMAGRVGRDERWQFSELKSETRVDKCGRPLYLERVSLNPESENPQSRWVMRDAGNVGCPTSVWIFSVRTLSLFESLPLRDLTFIDIVKRFDHFLPILFGRLREIPVLSA